MTSYAAKGQVYIYVPPFSSSEIITSKSALGGWIVKHKLQPKRFLLASKQPEFHLDSR